MKYLDVAKWEFMEKVKSKAFIISLVLMPIIIVGMGVLPTIFASKADEETVEVGIIDQTHRLVLPLEAKLNRDYRLKDGQPNYILRAISGDRADEELRKEANQLVARDKVEGYFYIPLTAFDSGKVEYRSKNVGNFRIQERFSRAIEQAIVENRLVSRGLDTALIRKLTADVDVKSIKLSEKGEETVAGFGETFISAYIGLLMIVFMVLTTGQLLVRSVAEEKSSRIIEVILSSCSARDLMAGKIIGLSGLGILQMIVYGLIGFAVALKTNANVFVPEYVALSMVYALLGYLFYAAIFVAVGSPVTTEQEAQQVTGYISLLLVAPFALMILVMQNPNSTLVKVLSFIPIFTPTIMVLRIPIQMPPTWEIVATIAVLIASTVVVMWAAGKIFRTAILVYGKRPSLPELWRWVKAA